MNYYMVFGSTRRPRGFTGGTYIDWNGEPIGVYSGESPEDACKAAATDHGSINTFFAVEGFVWGIALMEPTATRLGDQGSPAEDRMNRMLERMEANDRRILELTEKAAQGNGE